MQMYYPGVRFRCLHLTAVCSLYVKLLLLHVITISIKIVNPSVNVSIAITLRCFGSISYRLCFYFILLHHSLCNCVKGNTTLQLRFDSHSLTSWLSGYTVEGRTYSSSHTHSRGPLSVKLGYRQLNSNKY